MRRAQLCACLSFALVKAGSGWVRLSSGDAMLGRRLRSRRTEPHINHCAATTRRRRHREAAMLSVAADAAIGEEEDGRKEQPHCQACFDGVCDVHDNQIVLDETGGPTSSAGATATAAPAARRPLLAARPTVWSEFSALAAETGAINLGQGFPNWSPPDFVVAAAHAALAGGFHQYTRTAGHPRLVELLAGRYTKHFGRAVDPYAEVAITIGASQALYVTMQTILSPGDEVILLEPFFDLYVGQIALAFGVPRYVPLTVREGRWELDAAALRAAFGPRTRAVVVNTPHNPTGKVFTAEELAAVADVVRDHPNVLVVSDEVYKYMVYDDAGGNASGNDGEECGNDAGGSGMVNGAAVAGTAAAGAADAGTDAKSLSEKRTGTGGGGGGGGGALSAVRHVHFATLPGMWDRTVTISSAGKTFSVTGWQVGWLLGPRRIVAAVQAVLPYMQFCAPTPMQEAMATALEEADRPYRGHDSYYDWLRRQYAAKRSRLEAALIAAGIQPMKGSGGFFLIGDVGGIAVPKKYLEGGTAAMPEMTPDWAFCRWMAKEHGLIAIPTSAFFSPENRHRGGRYVRFCFCKTDETLAAAAEALAGLQGATGPAAAAAGRAEAAAAAAVADAAAAAG
ncbi:unnamed protein product, partial [Phaeothamnion confervicola]